MAQQIGALHQQSIDLEERLDDDEASSEQSSPSSLRGGRRRWTLVNQHQSSSLASMTSRRTTPPQPPFQHEAHSLLSPKTAQVSPVVHVWFACFEFVCSQFIHFHYVFVFCVCVCVLHVGFIDLCACMCGFSVVISWFVIKVSKLSCVPRISLFGVFFREWQWRESFERGAGLG